MKYENIFAATEARFLLNALTQNRPPDSKPRQTQILPDHAIGAMSCYQVAFVRT
jgi:hypothetical protein